jgi:hypothetical protein
MTAQVLQAQTETVELMIDGGLNFDVVAMQLHNFPAFQSSRQWILSLKPYDLQVIWLTRPPGIGSHRLDDATFYPAFRA